MQKRKKGIFEKCSALRPKIMTSIVQIKKLLDLSIKIDLPENTPQGIIDM